MHLDLARRKMADAQCLTGGAVRREEIASGINENLDKALVGALLE
ncbi:MAG: hypothetical protein H6Q55_2437, partial [Deltaproteobacteria bacterium]|nr:hypothetical protein [Deltaproteobacteria bacterium]